MNLRRCCELLLPPLQLLHQNSVALSHDGIITPDWLYLSLDEAGRAGASHPLHRDALHGPRRRHTPVCSSKGTVGSSRIPGVLNHGVDVLQGAA